MAIYDDYMLTKVYGYNLDMAVYYARNCLILWVSGEDIAAWPSDYMSNFVWYKLYKNMVGPCGGDIVEAIAMLKEGDDSDLFNRF